MEVEQLRQGWSVLLGQHAMRGLAVVDAERNNAVLGFGASVFVPRFWVDDLVSKPAPHLVVRLPLLASHPHSPILMEKAIASGNAGAGLDLVVVDATADRSLPHSDWIEVLGRLMNAFAELHRGFKLRSALNEVYGPEEYQWCTAGANWFLRSDYAEYYLSAPERLPPKERYPMLVGIASDEVRPGTVMWELFRFRPPVLGLSGLQQRVLELAVDGLANNTIAARLGVDREVVMNAFRRAYDKAEGVLTDCSTEDGGKRQQLIRYISEHREELRPWPRRRRGLAQSKAIGS